MVLVLVPVPVPAVGVRGVWVLLVRVLVRVPPLALPVAVTVIQVTIVVRVRVVELLLLLLRVLRWVLLLMLKLPRGRRAVLDAVTLALAAVLLPRLAHMPALVARRVVARVRPLEALRARWPPAVALEFARCRTDGRTEVK